MASEMTKQGFAWPPNEASTGNIGWQLYLPVSLRERDPLILRLILGKYDSAAPPAEVGDAIMDVGILSFDELANVMTLEDTVVVTFSFIDAVNPYEFIYQDIDVSGYCNAATTHLWVVISRNGANELDTLDDVVYYVNGRTLIEEDEP